MTGEEAQKEDRRTGAIGARRNGVAVRTVGTVGSRRVGRREKATMSAAAPLLASRYTAAREGLEAMSGEHADTPDLAKVMARLDAYHSDTVAGRARIEALAEQLGKRVVELEKEHVRIQEKLKAGVVTPDVCALREDAIDRSHHEALSSLGRSVDDVRDRQKRLDGRLWAGLAGILLTLITAVISLLVALSRAPHEEPAPEPPAAVAPVSTSGGSGQPGGPTK